jgi:hypothetical protein
MGFVKALLGAVGTEELFAPRQAKIQPSGANSLPRFNCSFDQLNAVTDSQISSLAGWKWRKIIKIERFPGSWRLEKSKL